MSFLTPDLPIVSADVVRTISAPPELLSFIGGALLELTYSENWEQAGTGLPEDVAALFVDILDGYYAS